jgi:hypothetical protein
MRENLLYYIYRMGRSSIERGSRDTWTANPKRYAEIAAKMGTSCDAEASGQRDMGFWAELHKPELRDPRGYIIPSNQPDFPTATKFINALRETGITVQRATREFEVQGKRYPAGSYVVTTAQSFRPHVMDMFEPQVHPDVFPFPGSPPTPPYDNAGWTLAFQMGVQFDRILDAFAGPFEKVEDWNVNPPAGKVTAGPAGYFVSRRVNNAFIAANRLMKAGEEVLTLRAATDSSHPAGTFYVRAKGTTRAAVDHIATELGVSFEGTYVRPPATAVRLRPARVGLWDQYGGSIPSGWTRWILEQFEFPFERVFASALDAGDLNRTYDALVFVTGAIPSATGGGRGRGGGGGAPPTIPDLPAEYQGQMGRVTIEQTLPKVKAFIENGGTVVAIGESATNLAAFLKLPIESQLTENGAPLPRTKFYVPGSVLSARVDNSQPVAQGMTDHVDVFFDDSPAFKLLPNASGVTRVAWYDTPTPLRSGWAWGQKYLENGLVAAEAKVGKGRVFLFGPEILQRAQPHGTFKFLFNAIYASTQ